MQLNCFAGLTKSIASSIIAKNLIACVIIVSSIGFTRNRAIELQPFPPEHPKKTSASAPVSAVLAEGCGLSEAQVLLLAPKFCRLPLHISVFSRIYAVFF
jgi:hypothetical protein